MSGLIKILHIDPDYQVNYFVKGPQLNMCTSVPLQQAVELLKKEDFDLILSEPHQRAILKKPLDPTEPWPIISDGQIMKEAE